MPKKKISDLLVKNGMDVPFFVLMLTILAIGLIMLLSSSYVYAFHFEGGDSYYYFKRQSFFALVGIAGIFGKVWVCRKFPS